MKHEIRESHTRVKNNIIPRVLNKLFNTPKAILPPLI